MNRRFATTVSGCAMLVLTLTACGDDSGEKTEAWAKNVCDQVQPQVERIQAANEAIAEASEGSGEPAEVQEAYSSSYGELSAAFESLATAVDDAGDPPVEDGEELRTDAVEELTGLSQSYEQLQEASDELDTSDRAKFAEGLRAMVGQLEELGQSGDEALSKLQSGDLGDAMARQEGCQSPVPGDPSADESDDAETTDDAGDAGSEAPADDTADGDDAADSDSADEDAEDDA
ncbi:small secreted protein [Streptomyces otsuchiensis]|uniref:small secreted protein n=1 Tax=Streptomyces otsuchiensis TaxID=2681388 RepID=UPI0015823AAC|nr:small secreted protein [Streptomyces otsuchiensis]